MRPEIVCLCGSTRFKKHFEEKNRQLSLAGKIVLSVGCYTQADDLTITHEQKKALDELHKRKIDLADYVSVINVGGYIGESTRSEIEYATSLGKRIVYMETPKTDQELIRELQQRVAELEAGREVKIVYAPPRDIYEKFARKEWRFD